MPRLLDDRDAGHSARVSTGQLPTAEEVSETVTEAYHRYRGTTEGRIADYIPALAQVSPDLFGICVAGVRGHTFAIGDADVLFSIQSISKAFVFALLCDAYDPGELQAKLGVDNTGFPFDSVIAVEVSADRMTNALVNSGAIAATSLAPGDDAESKWAFIKSGLSRLAGRDLVLNEGILASESATNDRNSGLAHLLHGYGLVYCDPDLALSTYTRQCSLDVSARDLAVMGSTLANGGVNAMTHEQVLSPASCARTLAIMASCGLYERSGDWLFEIGLPGKSGVSGGIVTVSPGKGGLATYSPPLDTAGNSVRGQLATAYVARRLGLSLFASQPCPRD